MQLTEMQHGPSFVKRHGVILHGHVKPLIPLDAVEELRFQVRMIADNNRVIALDLDSTSWSRTIKFLTEYLKEK